jgi:hypothetical protein
MASRNNKRQERHARRSAKKAKEFATKAAAREEQDSNSMFQEAQAPSKRPRRELPEAKAPVVSLAAPVLPDPNVEITKAETEAFIADEVQKAGTTVPRALRQIIARRDSQRVKELLFDDPKWRKCFLFDGNMGPKIAGAIMFAQSPTQSRSALWRKHDAFFFEQAPSTWTSSSFPDAIWREVVKWAREEMISVLHREQIISSYMIFNHQLVNDLIQHQRQLQYARLQFFQDAWEMSRNVARDVPWTMFAHLSSTYYFESRKHDLPQRLLSVKNHDTNRKEEFQTMYQSLGIYEDSNDSVKEIGKCRPNWSNFGHHSFSHFDLNRGLERYLALLKRVAQLCPFRYHGYLFEFRRESAAVGPSRLAIGPKPVLFDMSSGSFYWVPDDEQKQRNVPKVCVLNEAWFEARVQEKTQSETNETNQHVFVCPD